MSSFRIRPRFKHFIKADKDELEHAINTALSHEKQFDFHHIPDHICIKIHPNERHMWSPQLDISFEPEGDTVIVRGLYGPNPTLWALFFFGYVVIGIATMAIVLWGFSVKSIGLETNVFWGIPALAIAAVVLYMVSQTGQKLGAQQMFDIHHFYERVTKDRVVVS